MCVFAKVDTLSFWKKYRPKAPVVHKNTAITLLKGFHSLVDQSPPPIRLRTDHFAQVMEPPPTHTLNTNITFAKLFQALKKLQRNKAAGLDGMKVEFILDARKFLHMPTIDNIQLFSKRRLSKSLFHWGGPCPL